MSMKRLNLTGTAVATNRLCSRKSSGNQNKTKKIIEMNQCRSLNWCGDFILLNFAKSQTRKCLNFQMEAKMKKK